MHVAELVVRTNDSTGELSIGEIKESRGGSWLHLAHGRIYGWGGGGYAAGSYFNISSWPVGIAHELGHILGLGHTNGNGLMGPAGGPSHFWGTWGDGTGTSAHTLYNRMLHKQLLRRGLVNTDEVVDGTSDNVGHSGNSLGLYLRNPAEMAYANKDAVTTEVDTAVVIDPLANDDRRTPYSSFYNEDLLIEEVGRVIPNGAGTVEILPNKSELRFTPAAGFQGAAYFNYTLRGDVGNNGRGWLSRAPVTVTVGSAVDLDTITLTPGEDRWLQFSGSISAIDYPTMADLYYWGDVLLLRTHPDATGSETLDLSIAGNATTLTIHYSGATRSAEDDLYSADGIRPIRFNPLLNDQVAGTQLLDNNISLTGLASLDPLTDKNDDFNRSYELLTATLQTPAMGALEIETGHRVFPDGSWGAGPTNFLIFTPAVGASGYATVDYTASDVDGTVFSGTARVLVGLAEITSPARDYTVLQRDMQLILSAGQIPASGEEFSGVSTLLWEVVRTPEGGTVTLASPTAPTTAATFSTAGRYQLRLTATDNGISKSLDRWVMVEEPEAEYTGGSELAPWITAQSTTLAGWSLPQIDTSTFGITVQDDAFSHLIDIAPFGTATWTVGTGSIDASRLVRPAQHYNATPNAGAGTALSWELDLGAEHTVAWVDLILSFEQLLYDHTLELLDASGTTLRTLPLQNRDNYASRVKIPVDPTGDLAVRFIRIHKASSAPSFPITKVRVIGQRNSLADLTVGATPSMSNVYQGISDFDAWAPLDGVHHQSSGIRAITDSSITDNWWELTLPQERELRYLMTAFLSGRAGRTLTVYDSDDTITWSTTLQNLQNEYLTVPDGTLAQRIRLASAPGEAEFFDLDEFDAYGVIPPTQTVAWSQLSGPGSALIASPTEVHTQIDLPTPGLYTLQLAIHDGTNTTAQEFTVDYRAESAPLGTGLADLTTDTSGAPLTVNLYDAFEDGETSDAALTYEVVAVSNPGLFATSPVGTISDPEAFQLQLASAGSSQVTIRATDADGHSTDLTFTITSANQPPQTADVIDVAVAELTASGTLLIDLSTVVTDPDGDSLTFTTSDGFSLSYLSADSAGAITLTGELPVLDGASGLALLPMQVTDGVTPPVPFSLRLILMDENRAPDFADQSHFIDASALPGYALITPTMGGLNEASEQYTWAILSGNERAHWSLDADTGALTPLTPLQADQAYALQIQVTDDGSPARSTTATVTIETTLNGAVTEELYYNISGGYVSNIEAATHYPDAPDRFTVTSLPSFTFPQDIADSYGRRVRGYLVAPFTGEYVFHLASDDSSRFSLSADETPDQLTTYIDFAGWTSYQNFAATSSAPIQLQKGARYYFEIVHAEGGGGDHLSLGWTTPAGESQSVIPASAFQPLTDGDADGLPDWWELTYLETLATSGTDDSDGDGISNLQEFLIRRHPAIATSYEAWIAATQQGTPPTVIRSTPLAGNATTTVDLSTLSGSSTIEFFVHAEDLGQSATHLLNGNGWSLRLEQWSNRGQLGVTQYGVNDWRFTQSTTPYGTLAHVVYVLDADLNQTHLYIDGVLIDSMSVFPSLYTSGLTLGATNIRDDAEPGILAFAAYDTALTDSQILALYQSNQASQAPTLGDQLFITSPTVAPGSTLGTIAVYDSDAYTFALQEPSTLFALDSGAGSITALQPLDAYEGQEFALPVLVTDATNHTSAATITIAVSAHRPVLADLALTVPEHALVGDLLTTLAATDASTADTLTYTITSGNDDSRFALTTDGQLTLADALDYETAPTSVLIVQVSDGTYTDQALVTITVQDGLGVTHLRTDFSTDPAVLQFDVPDPTRGTITLDQENSRLLFQTFSNTDMWTTRSAAPMAYALTNGLTQWTAETDVELDPTLDQQVTGLTVYEDQDGAHPLFGLGLHYWDGGDGIISLQGLGTNAPNISVSALSSPRARLRITCLESPDGADQYWFYYDLLDGEGMRLLTTYDFATDNARVGLYLKTGNAGRTAFFYEFALYSELPNGHADSDDDGMPDLLEYALGRNHINPRDQGTNLPELIPTDTDQLRYRFRRMKPDIHYTIQSSPNLTPGSWINVWDSSTHPLAPLEDWQSLDSDPSTTPTNFFRLQVSHAQLAE